MKSFFRDFGIGCMLALGLLAVWYAQGCSPGIPAAGRAGVAQASLVTLMRAQHAQPGDDRFTDTWAAYCGAFAVRRSGRVQLGTAAHCVTAGGAGDVRFVPPSGWGLGRAHVVYKSEARDVAFLDVEDAAGLVPLTMGATPGTGEHVRAFSPMYDQTSFGRVVDQYDGGWYETDQTVVFGWSGSPEVDGAGRVVGVIAKCPTTNAQCTPGRTLVTSLL
jgi:hypothetical protein